MSRRRKVARLERVGLSPRDRWFITCEVRAWLRSKYTAV